MKISTFTVVIIIFINTLLKSKGPFINVDYINLIKTKSNHDTPETIEKSLAANNRRPSFREALIKS